MSRVRHKAKKGRITLKDMYEVEFYGRLIKETKGYLKEGSKESIEKSILNSVLRSILYERPVGYNLEYLLELTERYTQKRVNFLVTEQDKRQLGQGRNIDGVMKSITRKVQKELEMAEELAKREHNLEKKIVEYIGVEDYKVQDRVRVVEKLGMVLEGIINNNLEEGEQPIYPTNTLIQEMRKQKQQMSSMPEIPETQIIQQNFTSKGIDGEKGIKLGEYYTSVKEGTEIPVEFEGIHKNLQNRTQGVILDMTDNADKILEITIADVSHMVCEKVYVAIICSIIEINQEIARGREKGYEKLEKEVKRLERTNARIEKSLKEITEEKGKMVANANREIKEASQASICKEEIESYQREIEALKQEIKIKECELKVREEELQKEKNRCASSTKRITTLEGRQEKYSNIEEDMMQMMIENNNLKRDIEEIEEVDVEPIDKHKGRVERLQDKRVLLIGGIGSGIEERLQKEIPNLKHIDVSDTGVNFRTGTQYDIVVIFTRVVSHSHVNRVRKEVGTSTPVVCVNVINNRLIIKEIDRIMHGSE